MAARPARNADDPDAGHGMGRMGRVHVPHGPQIGGREEQEGDRDQRVERPVEQDVRRHRRHKGVRPVREDRRRGDPPHDGGQRDQRGGARAKADPEGERADADEGSHRGGHRATERRLTVTDAASSGYHGRGLAPWAGPRSRPCRKSAASRAPAGARPFEDPDAPDEEDAAAPRVAGAAVGGAPVGRRLRVLSAPGRHHPGQGDPRPLRHRLHPRRGDLPGGRRRDHLDRRALPAQADRHGAALPVPRQQPHRDHLDGHPDRHRPVPVRDLVADAQHGRGEGRRPGRPGHRPGRAVRLELRVPRRERQAARPGPRRQGIPVLRDDEGRRRASRSR